jgi:hypothetical protein
LLAIRASSTPSFDKGARAEIRVSQQSLGGVFQDTKVGGRDRDGGPALNRTPGLNVPEFIAGINVALSILANGQCTGEDQRDRESGERLRQINHYFLDRSFFFFEDMLR